MAKNVSYDIRHYGAPVQSDLPSTEAIQAAIDACHESGGGIVQIPSGIFHSGTIYLKSNVILDLTLGAAIRVIENLEAFPETELSVQSNFHLFFRHALIFADKAENVGIRGQGIINCRGEAKAFEQASRVVPERYMNRPLAVRFVNCRNVRVSDLTISGHSQAPVNGLTLRNIKLTYSGGGTNDEAATLIENLNDKPNPNDAFPVSGLMLRHATHIDVANIQFSYKEVDARRTVVLENIQGGRVRDVAIHSPGGTPVFTSFDTAGLRIKDLSWKDTMNGPTADWQEFKVSTGKQSICIGQKI